MTFVAWFWLGFAATLALLLAAAHAGLRHRRRLHVPLAVAALAVLAATIAAAERMARERQFPAQEMSIHLFFAKSAALLVLAVVVTGVGLWWRPRWRRPHRLAVAVFLAATLVATGTGIWVFSLSTPK